MSEGKQFKEVPYTTLRNRVLTETKAEQACAEECLMIHEPAGYSSHPFLHYVVNTRHTVAIGKHKATCNMSYMEQCLCQQLSF